MAKQKLDPYKHTDGATWDNYFVDAKTGIIYFKKDHNGKRIKFSTKEKSGVQAKRFANAEFNRRIGKGKVRTRTLIREELVSWLTIKESEGLAYDTLNNVKRAARQLEEYWGDKLPDEISRESFADWCAWWRAKHPDIEMTNAVKYLNNFCNFLNEKVYDGRPLLPARLRFKDPNRHKIEAARAIKKERYITPAEFAIIRAAAANEDEALAAQIQYTMATRGEETLELDFDRIVLDAAIPVYRWTYGNNKAKKTGAQALHTSLIEPLKKLRDRRRAEGTNLLFPQKGDNQKPLKLQMIDWEAWRNRAGLDYHWSSHTFKHSCLTLLFNDPRNPQLLICKQYRTSLDLALKVYVKTTKDAMLQLRDSIVLDLNESGSDSGTRPTSDRRALDPLLGNEIGVPKGI